MFECKLVSYVISFASQLIIENIVEKGFFATELLFFFIATNYMFN